MTTQEIRETEERVEETVRSVQERTEGKAKAAGAFARKAGLAAVGLAGMAYDGTKMLWSGAADFLERAEKRGEQIERDFSRRATAVEEQAATQARKIGGKTRNEAENAVRSVGRKVGEQLQQVKKSRSATQEAAEEAGQEIAVVTESAEGELIEPLAGYATLTVEEIKTQLENLDREQLEAVRAYELATANRDEVLQAVEARINELRSDPGNVVTDV